MPSRLTGYPTPAGAVPSAVGHLFHHGDFLSYASRVFE